MNDKLEQTLQSADRWQSKRYDHHILEFMPWWAALNCVLTSHQEPEVGFRAARDLYDAGQDVRDAADQIHDERERDA